MEIRHDMNGITFSDDWSDITFKNEYGVMYALRCLPTTIEKVIFNNPATIVIWSDGTKTIVKCSEDDVFDPEKGLAMAICKNLLGDQFKNTFKEWIPEDDVMTEINDAFSKAIDTSCEAFDKFNKQMKTFEEAFNAKKKNKGLIFYGTTKTNN